MNNHPLPPKKTHPSQKTVQPPKRSPSQTGTKVQNKAAKPSQNPQQRPIAQSSRMPKQNSTLKPPVSSTASQAKRGISPGVILLIFLALVVLILAIAMLTPKGNSNEKPNSPSTHQGNVNPSPNNGNSGSDTTPPSNIIPPPEIEKPKLTVDSITETFDSGSYVIYGYPTIEIQDQPEITTKINTKLKELVDNEILPMVEQLRMEDTPGYLTSRLYNFSVSAGSGFYSIVVTVDTNEGITAGRSTFCWNFFADSGKYVSLRENCTDRYRLAVTIDGCIENVTSYDQVIHAWLIDVLTAEFDSEEFSFYFEGENMIAVLNNNLRLDSFIRDPILIIVPYDKISNIFPYQSKE